VFVQANDQASYLCVSGAGARDPAYQPFLCVIVAVARQPIDLGDKRVIVENMLHAVTLDQDQAGVDREGQVKATWLGGWNADGAFPHKPAPLRPTTVFRVSLDTDYTDVVRYVRSGRSGAAVHTERVTKLGWLDEIFNTPSVHRVHHGSNRQYLDKNYGGILMVWDKIFGTFAREEEKVIYGLTCDINTNNPIKIVFIEFSNIWRDVKKCRTMGDRLRIIFGGLSWRPSYFNSKTGSQKGPKA
jgi:hypothetical protein